MKAIRPSAMQEIDHKVIEADPAAGWTLMHRAGIGIGNHLISFAEQAGKPTPHALFFAGPGNNGGDAFVAARHCAECGWTVQVWLAGERGSLKGDAAKAAEHYESADLPVMEWSSIKDCVHDRLREFNPWVLIDGLLGTGAKGEPRGIVAEIIPILNDAARDAWCIAIDSPSGLDADQGTPSACCVRADLTLTLGLPKTGLLKKEACEVVGSLEVIDIGLPGDLVEAASSEDDLQFNALQDLRKIWKSKARESHKGTYGRVLIIGGGPGMSGAPALAAMAALNSGAGLVSVLTPDSVASQVSAHAPEIMVRGVASSSSGLLDGSFLSSWQSTFNDMDCVVIGPGLGRSDEMILILRQLIRDITVPLIMDADALNNLERQAHWMERAKAPLGITPHPGEMSRLFGQPIETIQNDREGTAFAAAKFIQSTVILKGAGTVIAHPEKGVFKNLNGNPGMASGGTGDVLSGIFGSLVAQGYDLFEAARLAVYLHGKAGDIAARKQTQSAMTASGLIEALPSAFRMLEIR